VAPATGKGEQQRSAAKVALAASVGLLTAMLVFVVVSSYHPARFHWNGWIYWTGGMSSRDLRRRERMGRPIAQGLTVMPHYGIGGLAYVFRLGDWAYCVERADARKLAALEQWLQSRRAKRGTPPGPAPRGE
jgi:hypothetical protein